MHQRIVILGSTGSGKTTLARQLAERLGCPHVELDSLHWEPGWVEAEVAVFRERVQQATSGERWVVDGNYGKVRDVLWKSADTLVWLDYSLPLILWRLWWRTLRRVFGREELWNGNREDFRNAFLSRKSLFVWVFQTYWRRRRELPGQMGRPEYAHLTVVRLRSPQEAEQWLKSLE